MPSIKVHGQPSHMALGKDIPDPIRCDARILAWIWSYGRMIFIFGLAAPTT